MTSKVYSIGCSHTNGCMIDGNNGTSDFNKDNSFAGQIAKQLKAKHINLALNGASNQYIFRVANQVVADMDTTDSLFIIGWTGATRLEMRSTDEIFTGHPEGMDAKYIPYSLGALSKFFPKIYQRILKFAPYICDSTMLYDHWACYCVSLQNLFEKHNIKYIMCNTIEPLKETDNNKGILRTINQNYYYQPFNSESVFFNWADRKYKKTPCWHYPKEAHVEYAIKLMKEMNI